MSKLKFDPSTPLYTADKRPWRIDQTAEVLAALHAADKPVVMFVHGRGKEPNKGLNGAIFTEGKAVHKIALGYDVGVLFFNWNSAFKGFQFLDREEPLSHTGEAADSLSRVLPEVARLQQAHPSAPKAALLVHSMGSVVLQQAVQRGVWPSQGPLFSSVLLSQPDADDVGHAAWLEPICAKETVFVTFNADDHVLLRSTDSRPKGCRALGLGPRQDEPLANRARYIDLTSMGAIGEVDEDHEVFAKGAMNGQIHVCQFFEQVLKGKPVQLEVGANVERVDGGAIYRLKSERKPGAACLRVPVLP